MQNQQELDEDMGEDLGEDLEEDLGEDLGEDEGEGDMYELDEEQYQQLLEQMQNNPNGMMMEGEEG